MSAQDSMLCSELFSRLFSLPSQNPNESPRIDEAHDASISTNDSLSRIPFARVGNHRLQPGEGQLSPGIYGRLAYRNVDAAQRKPWEVWPDDRADAEALPCRHCQQESPLRHHSRRHE